MYISSGGRHVGFRLLCMPTMHLPLLFKVKCPRCKRACELLPLFIFTIMKKNINYSILPCFKVEKLNCETHDKEDTFIWSVFGSRAHIRHCYFQDNKFEK